MCTAGFIECLATIWVDSGPDLSAAGLSQLCAAGGGGLTDV